MNTRLFTRLPGPLLLAGLLAACASSPMSRIDANRALYESWPVEVRQAVLDGRVEKGMTQDMVRVSIGKPSQVQSRVDRKGQIEEVWVYGGGSSGGPLRNTNVSIGVGPVAVGGLGGGSGGSYADYREVVFANGKVVSGEDPK